jgi:hypothetical protein
MPGISQKLLKYSPADVDQAGVIAALKVNLRLVRQAVVEAYRWNLVDPFTSDLVFVVTEIRHRTCDPHHAVPSEDRVCRRGRRR